MDKPDIFRRINILHADHFFHFFNARIGDRNRFAFFIDLVIVVFHKIGRDAGKRLIKIARLAVGSGDNERRAGFVD